MPRVVVIDGLPLFYSAADLERLCARFGTVRRVELMTMPDGTSLGYARVELASEADAEAVVRGLHRYTVSNYILSVHRRDDGAA